MIGGSVTVILLWFLRSLRWYLLLKQLNNTPDFFTLYIINSISNSFAITTPFQSGEIIKVEMVREDHSIERIPAYSSLFVEKVFDFLIIGFLFIISFPSLSLFENGIFSQFEQYIIIFGILGIGSSVLVFWIIFKKKPHITRYLVEWSQNLRLLTVCLVISIVSWMVVALGWQFMFQSIGIHLSFFECIEIMSVISLINIIFLVPGSFGVLEVGVAELLMLHGYDASLSQSGAIILRGYWLLALLLGLIHLLIYQYIRNRRKFCSSESV
jgi:uncharacterized membrane protein YbhN (UPF0104 family)